MGFYTYQWILMRETNSENKNIATKQIVRDFLS